MLPGPAHPAPGARQGGGGPAAAGGWRGPATGARVEEIPTAEEANEGMLDLALECFLSEWERSGAADTALALAGEAVGLSDLELLMALTTAAERQLARGSGGFHEELLAAQLLAWQLPRRSLRRRGKRSLTSHRLLGLKSAGAPSASARGAASTGGAAYTPDAIMTRTNAAIAPLSLQYLRYAFDLLAPEAS